MTSELELRVVRALERIVAALDRLAPIPDAATPRPSEASAACTHPLERRMPFGGMGLEEQFFCQACATMVVVEAMVGH